MCREFEHSFNVYYEDTDAEGVVYHANYLHFFERARSEILSELLGYSFAKAHDDGCMFVVHEMWLKYLKPARLGERITVRSRPRVSSPLRVQFEQEIYEGGRRLVTATVDLVCINRQGELIELPEVLQATRPVAAVRRAG